MPSSITHWLIAREAQKQLPAEVASVLSAAPETFFLGAQGGDMFFFAKSSNRAEGNLGKYLHRNETGVEFPMFHDDDGDVVLQGTGVIIAYLLSGKALGDAGAVSE